MAHPPMLRPEPPERRPSQTTPPNRPTQAPDSSSALNGRARVSGEHETRMTASTLIRDLLLHEIVVDICHSTNATAAAIALEQEGEFICRATTGENAPDLGMRLNITHGLSGECIQTCDIQRCDDAQVDPRVDAEACRRLRVRSLLVVPLLSQGDLLGIVEVFSPLPYAFDDSDVHALLSFSKQIQNTVIAPPSDKDAQPVVPAPPNSAPPPIVPLHENPSPAAVPTFLNNPAPVREYWTPYLTIAIIVVALVLGWALGQSEWFKRERPGASSHAAPPNELQQSGGKEAANPPSLPADQSAKFSYPPAPPQTRTNSPDIGALTVYERGRIVFQMKPALRPSQSEASGSSEETSSQPTEEVVQLSPEAAKAHLLQRVEPSYPLAARQARIQGIVVLEASVGKDGSVTEIKALSGDSQLVGAAAEAVRQWQYRPYAPKGRPVEFATQVSLSFTLP